MADYIHQIGPRKLGPDIWETLRKDRKALLRDFFNLGNIRLSYCRACYQKTFWMPMAGPNSNYQCIECGSINTGSILTHTPAWWPK